jgi:hypothetical protein
LGATFGPGLFACSSGDRTRDRADAFWSVVADAARADDRSLTTTSAIAELSPELGSLDRSELQRPSASLLAALSKRSSNDFASGRTVVVAGWLLSRTEVLLATVAAGVTR